MPEQCLFSEIILGERRRKTYNPSGIASLADSIRRYGLIQPLVLDADKNLVAGGRRYMAIETLRKSDPSETVWLYVPVVFREKLTPIELRTLELEENLKREDMLWQEQADALLSWFQIQQQLNPEASLLSEAPKLGMAEETLGRWVLVAEEFSKEPALREASGLSAAYNLIQRKISRAIDSELAQFQLAEEEPAEAPAEATPEAEGSPSIPMASPQFKIWSQDFLAVADGTWKPFNFIHCDFPYGISMDTHQLQGTRESLGRYEDSPEIYWELIRALLKNKDALMLPSCHIMFWFSMTYYQETKDAFEQAGFTVNPFPLIWDKSDGKGILPDPSRGPRRTYETAFLISRGDRKIVSSVSASISLPSEKAAAEHLSEKPVAMLRHFFRMFVDEYTEIFDPTCGSGTAIVAAEALGAKRGLGIEKDPDYAATAKSKLIRARGLDSIVKDIQP